MTPYPVAPSTRTSTPPFISNQRGFIKQYLRAAVSMEYIYPYGQRLMEYMGFTGNS
jgi:hypothetical protein